MTLVRPCHAAALLLLLPTFACSGPSADTPASEDQPAAVPAESKTDPNRPVEATSLLGEPLYRPESTGDALATSTANLEAALADREANPDDTDAWVFWVGRRLA